MGFFNKLKNVGSKILKIGGNALKTIGNIGNTAIDVASKNAGWVGNIAGGALTALGMPYLGAGAVAGGQAIQAIANNTATKNVVRGINDVGNSALDASRYLRK